MIRRRFQIGALEKRGRTYRLRYRVDIIGRDGTVGRRERKSVPFGKVTKQQAIRLRDELAIGKWLGPIDEDKRRAESLRPKILEKSGRKESRSALLPSF